MLAKTNRFHGNKSVKRVYKLGRPARGKYISLHVYQDKNIQKRTRVGVVVSRKVSNSAVVRNRIRRRVYEQLRSQLTDLSAPVDLLATVYQSDVASIPAEQLASEVENLLKQAHLVN